MFGGVVAAVLPVLVGAVAVFGSVHGAVDGHRFTDVSIFSINLVTALGLGLAIDYSLFIVSRFREERSHGRTVDDAVVRTVETAGRTVAFSASPWRLAQRAADLPALLPAIVRLRAASASSSSPW